MRYMGEQKGMVANLLQHISTDEKRGILEGMGYSKKDLSKMSPKDIDKAISGSMENQIRTLRVNGMTREELQQLPLSEMRKYLVSLGVPKKDARKAKSKRVKKALCSNRGEV